MAVEIEYFPERTETTQLIVGDPSDGDTVLRTVEDCGHEYYEVEREATVTDETYVVHTWDAYDDKTAYWIEQTDDGDWCVTKRHDGDASITRSSEDGRQLSTRTVREALRERHGVELVN